MTLGTMTVIAKERDAGGGGAHGTPKKSVFYSRSLTVDKDRT